jgi:hypothetical protein
MSSPVPSERVLLANWSPAPLHPDPRRRLDVRHSSSIRYLLFCSPACLKRFRLNSSLVSQTVHIYERQPQLNERLQPNYSEHHNSSQRSLTHHTPVLKHLFLYTVKGVRGASQTGLKGPSFFLLPGAACVGKTQVSIWFQKSILDGADVTRRKQRGIDALQNKLTTLTVKNRRWGGTNEKLTICVGIYTAL